MAHTPEPSEEAFPPPHPDNLPISEKDLHQVRDLSGVGGLAREEIVEENSQPNHRGDPNDEDPRATS